MKKLTAQRLRHAYERDGVSGVEKLCEPYNLPRAFCEPCEDDTPTWEHVCAVCWTVRDEPELASS